jgi:hypothetical protein
MPDVKTAMYFRKVSKNRYKKLFVCFVDFHKAFDTVIHPGIRYKLIRNGINGLF